MVSPLFRFLRSPATNGGVAPSRPIMRGASREAELQRELDVLYAERAALARQERAAALNLCRLQDSLDALSNEITRRARTTRDVDLQTRAERMTAGVRAFFAKQDGCDIKPATVTAAIKIALGLERPLFAAVPPSPAAAAESHRASAQQIVDAGNAARGSTVSTDVRTGQPRPLPSPLATLDPVAASIVRAGRRARNEPTDDDR
jgi:hypothetical protein